MKLFEPFELGPVVLKNRVAVTSHKFSYRHWENDHERSTDKYLGYVRRRMEGGVGFFGLSALPVWGVDAQHPFQLEHVGSKLRRFADVAREHGCATFVQLHNAGVQGNSSLPGVNYDESVPSDGAGLVAFSAAPSTSGTEVAHEMSPDEIEAIIEGYGRLAELAVASGIDGVELHAGHGYLLQQSFTPWRNQRTDEWGPSTRFLRAVTARVRAGIGPKGVLGVRIATKDFRPPEAGGLTEQRLLEIALELADTGMVDYFNPTHGSQASDYGRVVGTYRRPLGEFLPSAARLRQELDGKAAVLGVGRVTTVQAAEDALQRGDCDFVGLTRAHIADPDILKKSKRGEADSVRLCVSANQGCIDRLGAGGDVYCFHNPDVGREYRRNDPQPVASPRSVVVVGAGPAGLKAAEIAARRGNDVVVLEASSQAGGRLGSITNVTSAHELVASTAWLEAELARMGVQVRLNVHVDEEVLASAGVDVVVLATGSIAPPPSFSTDGSVAVHSPELALKKLVGTPKKTLVVHDSLGTEEAMVTYEQLAASGHQVIITTPLPTISQSTGFTHRTDLLDRLKSWGCTLLERTDLVSATDGRVRAQHMLTGEIIELGPVAAVVLAQSRLPETSLLDAARRHSTEVLVVGDAYSPRDAMMAFTHGDIVARQI
ncbi:NAD(P)-binding protein [Pseudarthrobacter sp. NPDC058196]|uniref:oxidoreductase n=1 Tax=Pseudarthrobacter sp. NPDC058196 TaxID=3346376 RepID=UPI0036DBF703